MKKGCGPGVVAGGLIVLILFFGWIVAGPTSMEGASNKGLYAALMVLAAILISIPIVASLRFKQRPIRPTTVLTSVGVATTIALTFLAYVEYERYFVSISSDPRFSWLIDPLGIHGLTLGLGLAIYFIYLYADYYLQTKRDLATKYKEQPEPPEYNEYLNCYRCGRITGARRTDDDQEALCDECWDIERYGYNEDDDLGPGEPREIADLGEGGYICDGETFFGFTTVKCDQPGKYLVSNGTYEEYAFCAKHLHFFYHGKYPEQESDHVDNQIN